MGDGDPVARAAQCLRDGESDAAAALLQAVLETDPDRADALHLLGIALAQRGRFDAALPLLQRAAVLRPDDAAVHNNLGNTLVGCSRDGEAVQAFDRALALQPGHAKAWCNRGGALRRLGRSGAALESFEHALENDAGFVDALIGKADALEALLRPQEAIEALRAALAAGGDDASLRYALAMLGAEPAPRATPPAFVRRLFDDYAERFDAHLVDTLQYRTPELIAQALAGATLPTDLDVIDLGCGTGLCGPLLRPGARRLVGVDLSGAMLAKARARNVYDELAEAEVVGWLATRPGTFDLAVAADVLTYLGDLDPLLSALRGALRSRAALAFSVEDWPAQAYGLKPSGRYGHSPDYVRARASEHGFEVRSWQTTTLRREAGQPLEGHIVVLRRAA
jgi:predicted TPR repeat methyltransferase